MQSAEKRTCQQIETKPHGAEKVAPQRRINKDDRHWDRRHQCCLQSAGCLRFADLLSETDKTYEYTITECDSDQKECNEVAAILLQCRNFFEADRFTDVVQHADQQQVAEQLDCKCQTVAQRHRSIPAKECPRQSHAVLSRTSVGFV